MNILKNISVITQNRIDIVIGIEYVDYYENQYNTDFFIDLYIEHKRSFNGLSEGIYKGKEAHINRFNCLIDSIKANKGNDVSIPVIKCNNEYWVVNGFHRSSIINYYNLNGNFTIEYRKNINIGYYPTDIYFFKNRNYDSKYCNYTIKCFLKYYNKEFSCIILFPNKKNLSNDLYNKIKKELIYELNIPLSNLSSNFTNNFIQLLYYNENWCKNGGSIGKSKVCFSEGKNLKLLFIKKKKLNELVELKKEIRIFYNKGNHSIHIPDTQKECNSLLLLLNQNTISFMNKTPSLYVKFNNFVELFDKLKNFCKINNINTKKICITSSAVLSVYGIRDCSDMDLFIDKKYLDIFKNSNFDNHNKYSIDKHYSNHFEDIIYNPDNHFYFQNFKFCNLDIILKYKKYRVKNRLYDEKSFIKDKKDIDNMNCRNYRFTQNWFANSGIKKYILNYINKNNINKILEIGSFEGQSTVFFSDNLLDSDNSFLISVDPFFDSGSIDGITSLYVNQDVKKTFQKNISISKNYDKMTHYYETSNNFFLHNKITFNFIYVDGCHNPEYIKRDINNSFKVLEKNGILWLDDYLYGNRKNHKGCPKDVIDTFLEENIGKYEIIYKAYQIAIIKL